MYNQLTNYITSNDMKHNDDAKLTAEEKKAIEKKRIEVKDILTKYFEEQISVPEGLKKYTFTQEAKNQILIEKAKLLHKLAITMNQYCSTLITLPVDSLKSGYATQIIYPNQYDNSLAIHARKRKKEENHASKYISYIEDQLKSNKDPYSSKEGNYIIKYINKLSEYIEDRMVEFNKNFFDDAFEKKRIEIEQRVKIEIEENNERLLHDKRMQRPGNINRRDMREDNSTDNQQKNAKMEIMDEIYREYNNDYQYCIAATSARSKIQNNSTDHDQKVQITEFIPVFDSIEMKNRNEISTSILSHSTKYMRSKEEEEKVQQNGRKI